MKSRLPWLYLFLPVLLAWGQIFCLATPDPENPVREASLSQVDITATKLYSQSEMLARFPGEDYSALISLYVSTEAAAADTNDGSAAAPYRTIQRAIDMADTGTIVRVKAGDYSETIRFGSYKGSLSKPLVIFSEDGPGEAKIATPDSDGSSFFISGSRYVVLDGLAIEDSPLHAVSLTSVDPVNKPDSRYFTMRNCIVGGSAQDAVRIDRADWILIQNNTFGKAGTSTFFVQQIEFVGSFHFLVIGNTFNKSPGASAIIRGGSADGIFARNEFRDWTTAPFVLEVGGATTAGSFRSQDPFENPETYGIRVYNNYFSNVKYKPLLVKGARNTFIGYNTFVATNYATPDREAFIMLLEPNEISTRDLRFRANVIYNPQASQNFNRFYKTYDNGATELNFNNNVAWSAGADVVWSIPGGKTGNIDARPLFIDEDAEDYRLTSLSPGVNCEQKFVGVTSEDVAGRARDSADGLDCGAFEGPDVP